MALRKFRIAFVVITSILLVAFGGVALAKWRHLRRYELTTNLVAALLLVPSAIFSRGKSRVASSISPGEGIRAALANYAADSVDNTFPTATQIHNYTTLRALLNQNGVTLPESEAKMGFRFVSYEPQDTDNDGTPDSYVVSLIPLQAPSWKVKLTPSGIERVESK